MESFFSRFLNPLVLIAVLLLQTLALAVQVRREPDRREPDQSSADGKQVRLLRLWADAAVTPFERIAHYTGGSVYGAWINYVDLRDARRSNEQLKAEIARLRLEQAGFAEDALEGRRLQSLLAFQQHYVSTTVAAQVIGSSGSDQSRMLTLDKGSADGLKPDQPVITPDGIVGKLRDVFPHSSQLLLVNDQTSGAGVVLASTRIRAILRGSVTGRVQITNLTADSRIKPGEMVLTSGGDQVYPRGLPVGTIESIAPDPDHQPYALITIKPAANLFQLEEVLVITGTQSSLSAQAQADLASGKVTAEQIAAQKKADDETAQRAADALAARLPSLHENEPNASGGTLADPQLDPANPNLSSTPVAPAPAENAPGLVPKPAPSLHPDRYSTGATPPASALTPGGSHAASSSTDPTPSSTPKPQTTPKAATPKPRTPATAPSVPAPAPAAPTEPKTPPQRSR